MLKQIKTIGRLVKGAPVLRRFNALLCNPAVSSDFRPCDYYEGGAWSGHVHFAMDLVRATKPETVVELGTHHGESYFSFCQAIKAEGLAAKCYAVDTWEGDHQAGHYGSDIYNRVNDYNQQHYSSFSTLMQMTFDAALVKFDDQSLDILHIDGLHTYNAVKHDFVTWLPKMKPGGLILFHDIVIRRADFGVWKFWAELKQQYGQTFEFHHSCGLGVLRVPGGDQSDESVLEKMLFGDFVDSEWLSRMYAACSDSNALQRFLKGSK